MGLGGNMAEFRPFNLAEAQGRGTRNALATMQTMGAARGLKRTNVIDQLSRQAADTGEDLPTLLEQQGFQQEAGQMRDLTMKRQVAGMQWIAKRSRLVRDKKSWNTFRNDAIKMKNASPDELPEAWNNRTRQIVQQLSERTSKYQPTSLQKNVPYMARMLGISQKEATQRLTTGRRKGREGFRQDIYASLIKSQMYDPQEAMKLADDATSRIFGAGPNAPQSPAIGGMQEALAAPPTAPQEGMTATNPQTGERIVFRGGKWASM